MELFWENDDKSHNHTKSILYFALHPENEGNILICQYPLASEMKNLTNNDICPIVHLEPSKTLLITTKPIQNCQGYFVKHVPSSNHWDQNMNFLLFISKFKPNTRFSLSIFDKWSDKNKIERGLWHQFTEIAEAHYWIINKARQYEVGTSDRTIHEILAELRLKDIDEPGRFNAKSVIIANAGKIRIEKHNSTVLQLFNNRVTCTEPFLLYLLHGQKIFQAIHLTSHFAICDFCMVFLTLYQGDVCAWSQTGIPKSHFQAEFNPNKYGALLKKK